MWDEMSYYWLDNQRTMQERLRDEMEPECEDFPVGFFRDIVHKAKYWLDVDEENTIKAKGD